jgi:hypothetical protein
VIAANLETTTDGSEDGSLDLKVDVDGASTSYIKMDGNTQLITLSAPLVAKPRIVSDDNGINLESSYFGAWILMTGAGEVGMPDCSAANIGGQIGVWVRDASEQVEVVAYGDTTNDLFRLSDGTETGANDEADLTTTGNQGFVFTCMETNKWYVTREDGTVTDGGVAD